MKSDRPEVVVDENVGCRCRRLKLVEKWEESEGRRMGAAEGEYKRSERCNGISLGFLISSRLFFTLILGALHLLNSRS
jgi:hypothetical protein